MEMVNSNVLIIVLFIVLTIISVYFLSNYFIEKGNSKWEERFRGFGMATVGSSFNSNNDYKERLILVVEQHTETKKFRSYLKDMNGSTHNIDTDYALLLLEKKGINLK